MKDQEPRSVNQLEKPAEQSLLIPALLSVALMTILFRMPQPTIPVNLPFKAELALSLVLIVIIAIRYFSKVTVPSFGDQSRIIVVFLAFFTAWGAVSVLWAQSIGAVLHHTLIWLLYIGFFIEFGRKIRTERGIQTITATFIIFSIIIGALCVFDYVSTANFATSEGAIRMRYGKYAELLVTLSPILWAALIYIRKKQVLVVAALASILDWTTVMLSLSKGAFLAGLTGFVILFAGSLVFSPSIFRRRTVFVAALWLVFTLIFQIGFTASASLPSTTDYITGKADPTRSSSAMRVFTWGVAREMVADNWLIGVGADNFGQNFNQARSLFRQRSPDTPKEEVAEDYLAERAHNEPIQIAGELGLIGLLLFAIPFVIFGYSIFKKFRRKNSRLSPIFWASAAGMTSFAVSSLVSSFSFRSAQNGVVFFMVFAVGIYEIAKSANKKKSSIPQNRSALLRMPIGLFAGVLLAIYCLTKVFAEYQVATGERTADFAEAEPHFKAAVLADPEYAGAYLTHAFRSSAEGDMVSAAKFTRKAIDNGVGLTVIYSQLAKQQIANGDINAARATYREALNIYPRSIYIRIEYVVFSEKNGDADEASKNLEIARSMDLRQANGWYTLIKNGSVAAFHASQTDNSITPPAELIPENAIRQYLDKTPGL